MWSFRILCRMAALDVSLGVRAVRLSGVITPFGIELPVSALMENFHASFTGIPENRDLSVADASFAFRTEGKAPLPSAVVHGAAKWGRVGIGIRRANCDGVHGSHE